MQKYLKNKKWRFSVIVVLVCGLLFLAGCGTDETGGQPVAAPEESAAPQSVAPESTAPESEAPESTGDETAPKENNPMIEITMKNGGVIKVELDREAAPITVENFEKLVGEGFYDGLNFHRIIEGFMIQGGCPEGTGTGGPGYQIKGEFASNGWDNPIKHKRGVISMARSGMPDSAGSQFFIMHQDAPHLDGDYAAFGHVVEGMDVVDRIATGNEAEVMETVRVVD